MQFGHGVFDNQERSRRNGRSRPSGMKVASDLCAEGNVTVGRPSIEGGRHVMDGRAFNGIEQIAKHQSWSYENKVRLVATISKLDLVGKASHVKCVKIPIDFDDAFVAGRVFDSPVSDGGGNYRDSELRGTVDWNLCSGCVKAGA